MSKNIFLRFLLFLSPIILLIAVFFITDPFRVIYNYDDYSMDGKHNYVTANSDFVSTQIYQNKYKKHNYNSYIFGGSRTVAFQPEVWSKYIPSDSKIFIFNANKETLFGILGKLNLIEKNKGKINNALILLDVETLLETKNSTGHLFIKHPLVSGESWIDFYTSFFNAYLGDLFFIKYIDYTLFKKYRLYMAGAIDIRKIPMDKITNEPSFLFFEDELKDSILYYKNKESVFYSRSDIEKEEKQIIKSEALVLLRQIQAILHKNNTNYKIIINPLYDQIRLNQCDLNILNEIFGDENIFNFSGKNKYTDNIGYYYETSHFRPNLGALLLNEIYKK